MGLDKRKKILVVDDFKYNPFDIENSKLSIINKTTLPITNTDILLDRYENNHYSVQNVLNQLLQNDTFILQYLSKITNNMSEQTKNRLINSLSTSIRSNDISSLNNYDINLCNHISCYHNQSTSLNSNGFCNLSTIENDYLKSDMSNFDEQSAKRNFQKTNTDNELSNALNINISNDIVVDVEFDDSSNVRDSSNYIAVYVLNDKTNNEFSTNMIQQDISFNDIPTMNDCKYIYKKWLSGFKELYIYLPTTFTYYKGLNATYGDEHPDKNATFIKVGINYRHFKFNHIYQAHICAQSLPMGIHMTEEHPYYNDIILPSMLRSMCVSNNINNNTDMIKDHKTSMYYLYFTCYGTDSQAIRIFGD